MIKKITYSNCLSLLVLFVALFAFKPVSAQEESDVSIKGIILESGTGDALQHVSISIASTGKSADTNEKGEFTILCPDNQVELIIYLPGYTKRNIFINGRDFLNISLVEDRFVSLDNSFNSPLGTGVLKDASFAQDVLKIDNEKMSKASSFDQILQGKVAGLRVNQQSGMPGNRTFMNVRGNSSLYGASEPILFIDGMIHDFSYASKGLMEGHSLNPFDIVDINDITEISVFKDGNSYLGAMGSNGVISVNTEQKSEASTVIQFSGYGGLSLAPEQQDVLNPDQFRSYFAGMVENRGLSSQMNTLYPWFNGGNTAQDYYKYNNETNWQESIFKPSTLQKYHFFLKGGDDIATYNISTGYLDQKGMYEESGYNRFNLRINGIINITQKFSITPNAKLSLANSYTPNQGYSNFKNPLTSSLIKAPIMAAYNRDDETGVTLPYLDDEGDLFKQSNPVALVQNAMGTSVNYHFLSSIKAAYKLNDHFNISTLFGIDFNNARESIFLPNLGVVQVDSAANSPGDFTYEFRSTQNHTLLTYTNKTASGHSIMWQGGMHYMQNSYKYNLATDLNTPSDDFKSLGQGSKFNFLRTTMGDNRGLFWISYFSNLHYNFRNKYFLEANASYDGSSALNEQNRYNLYPSVSGAWRVSSEKFMSSARWMDDFKIRASWSMAGNMFNTVYDYSKLYYTSRRYNEAGSILREAIPNADLALEKIKTMNAGVDLSVFKQTVNIHADIYQSNVDNLIIQQDLPPSYGFTTYFDNGGKLETKGVELSADTRLRLGDFIWTLGASFTKQMTQVTELNFINTNSEHIITPIAGGEYITSVGNSMNAFYGYQTNGIYGSSAEAGMMIGPKGKPMQAGDVIFVEKEGFVDGVINENDKMIIGDPNPEFYGGLFSSFIFRNFELSAVFNYSVGNDIFNQVRYMTESMNSYDNQSSTVLERWTSTNTGATMPRASYGDPTGNSVFSDRWIEDGSFLRLQRLTLSYKMPRMAGIYKSLTVYATATNLLTFTEYSGYDPDFTYSNSPFYMGVDYGKMPQAKSFILGLKLDL